MNDTRTSKMNLIFDFDGTLCDSISLAVKTVNPILQKYNYKQTSVLEIQTIGLKGLISSRKVSQEEIDKIIDEYRKQITQQYGKMRPIKGIVKIVRLMSQNHKLGILTTNQVEIVKKFLDTNNLNCFDFVRAEKNVFDKDKGIKSIINDFKLDTKETYYIGDETRDVEASKNAGIKSVSVSWGAESKKLLENSKPFLIINKPEELLNLH